MVVRVESRERWCAARLQASSVRICCKSKPYPIHCETSSAADITILPGRRRAFRTLQLKVSIVAQATIPSKISRLILNFELNHHSCKYSCVWTFSKSIGPSKTDRRIAVPSQQKLLSSELNPASDLKVRSSWQSITDVSNVNLSIFGLRLSLARL